MNQVASLARAFGLAAMVIGAFALMLPGPWLGRVWFFGVTFTALACWFFWPSVQLRWRLRNEPAPSPGPPLSCPACGHTEHHHHRSGMYDARDPSAGRAVGGGYAYGTCLQCGSRWAKWDDAPPYVPEAEEWEQEVLAVLAAVRANQPLLQRTEAARIVPRIRAWFRRGLGR